jgi:hypothetical protein
MSDRKRDRIRTDTKIPKPSPNRHEAKRLQQESMSKDTETKDKEMTNVEDKEDVTLANDVDMLMHTADKDETVSDPFKKFEATKTDWKTPTQDNGSRGGWIIGKLPNPNDHWGSLSDAKKKTIDGFLKEDLSTQKKWPLSLKDGLKNIKFYYQIDKKKYFASDQALA